MNFIDNAIFEINMMLFINHVLRSIINDFFLASRKMCLFRSFFSIFRVYRVSISKFYDIVFNFYFFIMIFFVFIVYENIFSKFRFNKRFKKFNRKLLIIVNFKLNVVFDVLNKKKNLRKFLDVVTTRKSSNDRCRKFWLQFRRFAYQNMMKMKNKNKFFFFRFVRLKYDFENKYFNENELYFSKKIE